MLIRAPLSISFFALLSLWLRSFLLTDQVSCTSLLVPTAVNGGAAPPFSPVYVRSRRRGRRGGRGRFVALGRSRFIKFFLFIDEFADGELN